MAGSSVLEEWATWALSPSISAIVITLLVSLTLPMLLHYYLYRKAVAKEAPTFLLVGASGSGKTSLLTLFANGTPSTTHTSSIPASALCQLPATTTPSSDRYRSAHDPTTTSARPTFLLLDTPGHGKLRHHALASLSSPTALKGLIFVVDSAALSSPAGLTETAEYLHDVLLVLQKRHSQSRSAKEPQGIPVLVAANKQDVFTSLPARLVQTKLEEEIGRVRATRSKGLLDSGIGMEGDGAGPEEEANWLGEYGSGKFEFAQMGECGVEVKVVGGNVRGERNGEERVEGWWEWVGGEL